MGALFGSTPKQIPAFTGLQVNTAVQVLPIPILYGSPRTNLNLVYYNGFNVQKVENGGKGVLSGGKGGFSIEYFATLIMALGEGVIPAIRIIYQDQAVFTPADYPSNGANFFTGTASQAPWDVVVSKWPTDARSYKDTAYYAFDNAQLDASATVPQINLVPQGILAGSSPLNNTTLTITTGQYDSEGNPISFLGNINLGNADADPGQVIVDFLTNPTYGAGFPAQFLDTNSLISSGTAYDPDTGDQAVSTYCQAVGMAWSTAINNATSANSTLDRWCKNLVVAPIWDGEMLRFIPYWDSYASINPGYDDQNAAGIPMKYFNPYTVPSIFITLDHILQPTNKEEAPITYSRKDPMQVYNNVRIDFRDRENFFNDNVAEAKDEPNIELHGPQIDNVGLADEFSFLDYANISVNAQLRRNISVSLEYTFKLGPLWGWLCPMDILSIPDPAGWFLRTLVRVVSATDDEEDNVTIVAEEFPVGAQSPVVLPASRTTPPNQGATNVPAAPVFIPVIMEPTTAMLTATGFSAPQYIIGASGGYNNVIDPFWGGFRVWLSPDNTNYEQQPGQQDGPSIIGQLASGLTGANILTVDLSQCDLPLPSTSSSMAALGKNLCVLQDSSGMELLTYTTATLTSPNVWTLTGLNRGLYGTTARDFGAGSNFLFVDTTGNYYEASLPPQYVGQTFWVKLQSYNVYNHTFQELSSVVPYQFTVGGPSPTPPTPPVSMQAGTYRRLYGTKSPVINRRHTRGLQI